MKIVELCGLYGSGKTTLHSRLLERLGTYVITYYRLRKMQNIHRLVLSAVRIAPIVILAGLDSDSLRRFYLLVYLDVLVQELYDMKDKGDTLLLYEEGPMMIHFVLRARIKACRNQAIINKELFRNLMQWCRVLDGLILLDASDFILATRVQERPQRHMLKHCSLEEAINFYKEYRAIYENILATCKGGGLPILCLSTDECKPEQLAARAYEFIVSVTNRRTIRGDSVR